MAKQNAVLLLRGINVGGKNILPMQGLRDLLASLGAENVKTYIQSGNVVLQATGSLAGLATQLQTAIADADGFEPLVIALSADDFESVIAANPFAAAAVEGKHLHTWFFQRQLTNVSKDKIAGLAADSETYKLSEKAFYLHAPDGIGRSRLGAAVDKVLDATCTARNENTLQKILQHLRALQ